MIKKLGSRQKKVEAKAPSPPDVTLKEAQMAVFPNVADKIIFTKALSDIASHDPGMRADAARVIAGVRHKSSVKAIVAQMASEPSAQVRREYVKALMTLEMKEGVPAVERALTDQAASVRLAAVWALYHLAGVESAPKLANMFSDEDEEVRRRAAACVGWLGRKKFAVKLLPFLADSSVSVRLAAVETMANLRSRQVVSTLIKRLNDPEESVRKAIVHALKTITGKSMHGPFPTDERSLQRLIVRWHEWWQEEYHG
jgi:HEAT repeat protein